jgi:GMP synthase-like glutamine amidotransferase
MRALFVKQDHNSPSGLIGDAFAAAGYDITDFTVVPRERFASPGVTVTFPDPAAYDSIVAFGAIWAVYDDAAIGTWIHDEIAFTRAAMAAGVPVLGICFGGQMLAAAAGGTVERAPVPEIGWRVVDSAAPGLIDPGPWLEWHYDRFRVPDGVPVLAATVLPGGDRVSQAFTVGRSLGLQFHPEVTESVLAAWLESGGARELAGAGVDPGALLAQTRELEAGAALRTHELVRRFLSDVATRPVAAPRGGQEHCLGLQPQIARTPTADR